MNATESAAPVTPLRRLGDLVFRMFFRNWGLKTIAFVLAVVMFVFTRDEVTRVFTVPLRVQDDPERVLLTELPDSIQVQARGPWTRLNRLQDYDFGTASLDLREARPGPLEIDRAAIVMPSGVILAGIQYDHVDLRFDTVVEREIEIAAEVDGEPAPDYAQMGVEVDPPRWRVRGGESFVRQVEELRTEVLDISGADHDVVAARALLPPPKGVRFVDEGAERVQVTVRVVIEPVQEERSVVVAVAVPAELDPTGAVPRTYRVPLRGPLPDFRVLDGLGLDAPVVADAARVDGADGEGGGVAEVRFSWSDAVPPELRARLRIDRPPVRIVLPTPMAPLPSLDEDDQETP